MFSSIETFVSFFSVWYVCVITGCKMMVWQRSYQARCVRWKSHRGATERFAAEKISIAGFCFPRTRGSC